MLPAWLTPIKFTATGIKCDTHGCGYADMTVQSNTYADWLNKPCPKCGANLLTEKDYKLTRKLTRIASIINVIYLPIHISRYIISKKYRLACKKVIKTTIDMNGTGTMSIGKQEIIHQ